MKLGVRLVRGLGILGFVLGVIVLGVTPAFVPAGVAYAQTARSIVVEGNRRVEADTIRSYFKPGPDGRIGAFQIDEAYKSLIATGLFQDVRIEVRGGQIVVSVIENPVINRIAFEGNSKVKEEQLKLEIQSKERGTLSRPVVQSDVQRIVEVYRRGGRYDVRVDPKIIELPNNRVDLVFEINEGGRTVIRSVDFVGNRAYTGYRLREIIKTTESGFISFLQTTNVYDPDRLEADRDLIRRFYLRHGYIDVRVLAPTAEFDPERRGFIVTFRIEEGEQWRVGTVDVRSNVRGLDPGFLASRRRVFSGDVFNSELVEKTVEDMTIEAARQGFAFTAVRPRADRDVQTRRVSVVFTADEAARVYVEQINIRGNIRTRDHVIRREFDLAEGDPFNRALVSRAERRLKNLSYFKDVKITTEPGSTGDRVVIVVTVEEQSTGEFSVAGGYSSSDGWMSEVSVSERNLLGLGLFGKAAVTYGQNSKGYQLSFVEPYLMGYRVAWGIDVFSKTQKSTQYTSYQTKTDGASTRFGFTLREDLALQLRYSIYKQSIQLPQVLMNCNNINPNFGTDPNAAPTFPTPSAFGTTPATTPPLGYVGQVDCAADGEASLAVRKELAQGAVYTSLVGYDLTYNTLDNNRNPTSGIIAVMRQDFAGVGGDVKYIRTSADLRTYYEIMQDTVGVLHLQGGFLTGWGGSGVRMLDHFQMGPQLVRGFTPQGFGPRDMTLNLGNQGDALGGTYYWGASVEAQTPLYFFPKDSGVKVAVFADAGSLWNYAGPTSWSVTGETLTTCSIPFANPCPKGKDTNSFFINSAVGVGLLWASPFGPIRFDFAWPLTKQPWDRTQFFRFGGGTSF